jgi:hypothetical protein
MPSARLPSVLLFSMTLLSKPIISMKGRLASMVNLRDHPTESAFINSKITLSNYRGFLSGGKIETP